LSCSACPLLSILFWLSHRCLYPSSPILATLFGQSCECEPMDRWPSD
jgi:hypothetical protein